MLASREDGPFSSLIFLIRSKENLTSEAVRSWPFANFRPFLSLTVNSVPSALQVPSSAAMSGDSSAAAAGGQGSQSRDRSQSGDNFLAIHYGILSFLSESPLCKAI